MHAAGPIAIASIQVASRANSIHRGQSCVKRASPTHGERWLAQINYDALMTHHTTENICDQARKAILSLYRKTKAIKALPPAIMFYMFDVLIRPILTYGSDIWGFSKLAGNTLKYFWIITDVHCM